MGNLALRRLTVPLLALLLAGTVGCTVSRTRVNRRLESADTAWIVPGKTTFDEVITRLGLPPPVGRADDAPAWITPDSLRYVSQDSFSVKLEIGYIFTPVFERASARPADDLQIFFDRQGTVTRIARVSVKDGVPTVMDFREAAQ